MDTRERVNVMLDEISRLRIALLLAHEILTNIADALPVPVRERWDLDADVQAIRDALYGQEPL